MRPVTAFERTLDGLVRTSGRPASTFPRVLVASGLIGGIAEQVAGLGLGARRLVVCDENTGPVAGNEIARRLRCPVMRLERPKATLASAERLAREAGAAGAAREAGEAEAAGEADALIAVGSGTINDLVKMASALRGVPYIVIATAPSMNGYVTATASLERNGLKLSLPARSPVACLFDPTLLAKAPVRLRRAGIGDALARATCQVDCLLAHHALGTEDYGDLFAAQEPLEGRVLAGADGIVAGDEEAVTHLIELLVLGGFAMLAAGSSAPASQGEHLISHYIDMLARPNCGALHGEQVALATLTMTRLQHWLAQQERLPAVHPTRSDVDLDTRFGDAAQACRDALAGKALDRERAQQLDRRLRDAWPSLRHELARTIHDPQRLENRLRMLGLPVSSEEIGLDPAFYRQAVLEARLLRDRWTALDLLADMGALHDLV